MLLGLVFRGPCPRWTFPFPLMDYFNLLNGPHIYRSFNQSCEDDVLSKAIEIFELSLIVAAGYSAKAIIQLRERR